ncbi:MAG: flavin reductase family protein [Desulfovibrionaceae bacterium]
MKRSMGAKPMAYPTPVFVVGTYDAEGRPNIMTASWGGLCCSKPPCLSVSLRAATYSHAGLMARKAFTVSIPSAAHVAQADFVGMVSGRDVDKWAAAGLTAVRSDVVDAPYVAEFPMVIECEVVHVAELGLHTQFVGEIKDIKMDEAVLGEGGVPDIEKLAPFSYAPECREYRATGPSLGKGFSVGAVFKKA